MWGTLSFRLPSLPRVNCCEPQRDSLAAIGGHWPRRHGDIRRHLALRGALRSTGGLALVAGRDALAGDGRPGALVCSTGTPAPARLGLIRDHGAGSSGRPRPRRPQDRIREHDEIVHRAPSPPERTDIAPGIGQRGQRQATVLDNSAALRPSMRLTTRSLHCAVSRMADDMQQRVVLKTPRQWQAPEGRCSGVRKRNVVGQSERECRGPLMEGGWRVRGIHRPGGSTQI